MFDIGFLEIIVILVITLLVIGPERMPEVARKIGQFLGKTKRFINSVKQNSEITDTVREIQESINLDEEKKHLEQVTGSLQDDLDTVNKDLGIDEEISRPTFGGEEPPVAIENQYNKAPAQPIAPAKPAEIEEITQENTASTTDTQTVETDTVKVTDKSSEKA